MEKSKLVMWISEGKALEPEKTRNSLGLEVGLCLSCRRSSGEVCVVGEEPWETAGRSKSWDGGSGSGALIASMQIG